jgi:hypothetical protein
MRSLKEHSRSRFLAALLVLGAILCLPLAWVGAQSRPDLESTVARDSARLDDLSARVEKFSDLPTDVALLKAEVGQASRLLWWLMGGGMSLVLAEIAHRIRSTQKRRESEDNLLGELRQLKERLKP